MLRFGRREDVLAEHTTSCEHVYNILDSSEDVTIQRNGETAVEDAEYEEAVGALADLDTGDIDEFTVQYRRGTLYQRMSFRLPYEAESTGDQDIVVSGTYNAAAAD